MQRTNSSTSSSPRQASAQLVQEAAQSKHSSIVHLVGRAGAIEYARSSGAPAAELFVPLSGVAIIAGGLSVALGVGADLSALILAAFALSVMFFMHAFWKEQDEQAVQNQFAHFMKNVAMAGGALVIFWAYNQAQGGAPLSITDPLFGRG